MSFMEKEKNDEVITDRIKDVDWKGQENENEKRK